MVKGKHNTARPRELKKQIVEFLERYIKDIDFESDDTIINCNTYQGIIFNHNLVINYNNNFNHNNHLNNSNNAFYQSKNKKNNHDHKYNSTHKK